MNTLFISFFLFIFTILLSKNSLFKNIDSLVVAYIIGALGSYLLGPFDVDSLQILIGLSIGIGFPLLVMGANTRSLFLLRKIELVTMLSYGWVITLISTAAIFLVGKEQDFAKEILLLSSSFIGSSPNLFLTGLILKIPVAIQLKAQILDWVGSSFLFFSLMLTRSRKGLDDASEDVELNQVAVVQCLISAVIVATLCLSSRYIIDGIWRDFLSLVALVFFSVMASFLLDGEYKDSAIKLSSHVFILYGVCVGMMFKTDGAVTLSASEFAYPIILILLSYGCLRVFGWFHKEKNSLSLVVLSSSILSPMIAALVISKLEGKERIPLSLRLSIIGLISACFYSTFINFVAAWF